MKIRQINVYIVETGSFRPVIAELITDEGIAGIGEAAVGFGIGCHGAAAMIKELGVAFLLNRDPNNIADIWNDFYYHTFWGKGGGPIFYAAVSALECALWDIKGKALGIPIYELLGGRQRDEILCYANGWSKGETPEYFAERAIQNLERGFSAMKMYPLNLVDKQRRINSHHKNRAVSKEEERLCIEKVKAVRKAIGDEPLLLVDFTAEGTPDVMIRLCKELEQFAPYYFEEPADPFDPDACKNIHDMLHTPVAAGERVCTRYGFARLIEKRAVDIVQPDPGITGGILESWRIASHAETYSMRTAPHNCGGPVLTAACVQLDACISNFAFQEVFPYLSDTHYNIVLNPLEKTIKNGRMPLPTGPGLGVELNHEAVAPYLCIKLT